MEVAAPVGKESGQGVQPKPVSKLKGLAAVTICTLVLVAILLSVGTVAQNKYADTTAHLRVFLVINSVMILFLTVMIIADGHFFSGRTQFFMGGSTGTSRQWPLFNSAGILVPFYRPHFDAANDENCSDNKVEYAP